MDSYLRYIFFGPFWVNRLRCRATNEHISAAGRYLHLGDHGRPNVDATKVFKNKMNVDIFIAIIGTSIGIIVPLATAWRMRKITPRDIEKVMGETIKVYIETANLAGQQAKEAQAAVLEANKQIETQAIKIEAQAKRITAQAKRITELQERLEGYEGLEGRVIKAEAMVKDYQEKLDVLQAWAEDLVKQVEKLGGTPVKPRRKLT